MELPGKRKMEGRIGVLVDGEKISPLVFPLLSVNTEVCEGQREQHQKLELNRGTQLEIQLEV